MPCLTMRTPMTKKIDIIDKHQIIWTSIGNKYCHEMLNLDDLLKLIDTTINYLNKDNCKCHLQSEVPLSNEELNSGWRTTIVDHGKEDSMAGWRD